MVGRMACPRRRGTTTSLTFTGLLAGVFFLFAGFTNAQQLNFKADLTGAQQSPPVVTDTTGEFTIRFNKEQTEAKFNLKVKKGVAISQAHLHCEEAGTNGPIVAFLQGLIPGGFDVPRRLAKFSLTDRNIAVQGPDCEPAIGMAINDLRDLRRAMEIGGIYVNVHSVANPSGEIRGQVTYASQDTDGDGIKDKRDPDIDGDGILNAADPFPRGLLRGSAPPSSIPAREFFWPPDAGTLTCDPPGEVGNGSAKCSFDGSGKLTVSLESWGAGNTAVLHQSEPDKWTGTCGQSINNDMNNPPNPWWQLVPDCKGDDDLIFRGVGGVTLFCNGEDKGDSAGPVTCSFDGSGNLSIRLSSWFDHTGVLHRDLTKTGRCKDSINPDENLPEDWRLELECLGDPDGRALWWPQLAGELVLKEWYTDIPWHQKLGTFAGNEIDEALVLPYAALRDDDKRYCKLKNLSNEECMLRVGINNILGTYRTDTPYDPESPTIKSADECKDPTLPCIEVKLELSNFRTRSTPDATAVELDPSPFGVEPQHQATPPFVPVGNYPDGQPSYYGGYAITDGSTYAPQMPWYMSHYCQAFYAGDADTQDPVCYADYFSPFNDGFNLIKDRRIDQWPLSAPWSVFPVANAPSNHCKPGETKCTLVMGGFDLKELPEDASKLQYKKYNVDFLLTWFNAALEKFPTDRDNTRHFPWSGAHIDWAGFIYPRATHNPFLGTFEETPPAPPEPSAADCDTTLHTNGEGCTNTGNITATHYLYPRQCKLSDLTEAAAGTKTAVDTLRHCSLNYELHHNGYWPQWPRSYWQEILDAGMIANQYGRTSFLFAGVPGMQLPVSFYKEPAEAFHEDPGELLSIYQRVYNASIFSLYMPITNVADDLNAFGGALSGNTEKPPQGRNYSDTQFYHTLLMSNHMESDPWEFADGIRGKVLWHDEYRTEKMYEGGRNSFAPDFSFAAAFDPTKAPSPFHNNTCDGCHVRNGSGVPINTQGKLDPKLQKFMTDKEYVPFSSTGKDYTFTGEIRPMKLVFFDLQRDTIGLDASRYSEPLVVPAALLDTLPQDEADDFYYNNKIMNFYGDSFHVTPSEKNVKEYNYSWSYEKAETDRLVVKGERHNKEISQTYEPLQVKLGNFTTSPSCDLVENPGIPNPWPESCGDVDNAAIHSAIDGSQVGFMLLNGKRLGNLSVIEAIPNQAILGFREGQIAELGKEIAGEIIWNAGSRDGVNGEVRKECKTNSLIDCYIGRFGYLGDRVSLEDQVANAAFVEMNITTKKGYEKLYPKGNVKFPIRYDRPNCGPANKTCKDSKGNSDLSEEDVERMADYARWLGNPTRSEFQVSQPEVIEGEEMFKKARCSTCHVIAKIAIDPNDTMLSKFFRDRLATRVTPKGDHPFLSYIGTDLLMHDMGYLSQVGKASEAIRDKDTGVVMPGFENYVQKIRTPPLKGLRFNRFVTDSHRNTKEPTKDNPPCDFLLHDGRACDAIEAAFLHDGPAVNALGMIEKLKELSEDQIRKLRAFLYSL